MTPEKTEMIDGSLCWSEEERLTMLALLLENVGADKAVRLGEPNVWRAAVAELNDDRVDQESEASEPLRSQAQQRALEDVLLAKLPGGTRHRATRSAETARASRARREWSFKAGNT